jgi:hypothetical protein
LHKLDYYIHYSREPAEKKNYLNWLKAVTNPKKSGFVFNQIADLKARDLIPEDEISEHEVKTYPYRRLDSLFKVKTTDCKLWLMRFETWFGLDPAGQEKHISVNDLDYYRKPVVTYERIPNVATMKQKKYTTYDLMTYYDFK